MLLRTRFASSRPSTSKFPPAAATSPNRSAPIVPILSVRVTSSASSSFQVIRSQSWRILCVISLARARSSASTRWAVSVVAVCLSPDFALHTHSFCALTSEMVLLPTNLRVSSPRSLGDTAAFNRCSDKRRSGGNKLNPRNQTERPSRTHGPTHDNDRSRQKVGNSACYHPAPDPPISWTPPHPLRRFGLRLSTVAD